MKVLETYNDKCIGCNSCVTACSMLYFKENVPEKSCIELFPEEHGNFRLSVCNQCGTCVDACPTEALTINKFGVVMLNKKLCNECHLCVDACPTDNMRLFEGAGVPFKCIACGACARECPADALAIVKDN